MKHWSNDQRKMALFSLSVSLYFISLFLKALKQSFMYLAVPWSSYICGGEGVTFKLKKTCHLMFSKKDAIYIENL